MTTFELLGVKPAIRPEVQKTLRGLRRGIRLHQSKSKPQPQALLNNLINKRYNMAFQCHFAPSGIGTCGQGSSL